MGDKIAFIIDELGQVVMTAKTLHIDDIFGMIHSKKRVTIEDMNIAIVKGMLGGEDVVDAGDYFKVS